MAKIILTNIGRGKVSKTIELADGFTEQELGELAYKEVSKHLLSKNSTTLDPDEQKGEGYWKVYAGMYHVGDVQIIK